MTATTPQPDRRSFALQALHVVTLMSVAFTARLYATLGDKPMFFSVRQAGAVEVLLFVLILSVVLPGLLVGLLWGLRRLEPRVAAACFLLLTAVLLTAIALPLCKQLAFLPDPAACGFAAVLGAAATFIYWKFPRLRAMVTILAPITVLSPAIYLLATPTSQLLFHRAAPTSASAAPHAGNSVPVVVVVFDEFSGTSLVDAAGQIDASLLPNFAALARESIWFRNASSVAAETDAALPAILTGNLPLPGTAELDWHAYPDNLFTLLRGSHQFSVFEPVTNLCPDDLRGRPARWSLGTRLKSLLFDAGVLDAILILPRHWPLAVPDVSGRFCNFAGTAGEDEPDIYYDRREILDGFIDKIQAGPRPGLFFIHSVLPHVPWKYLPSGKQYDLEGLPSQIRDWDHFAAGVAGLDRQSKCWLDDPVVVAQAQQRHLLQVQFVDRELGRLMRHLRGTGLYDRSLIVITADHGLSFVPGQPFRGICQEIYPETLSIPLFIKLPGQHEGRISQRNVEEVDILPTIADVLKIRMPWTTRGSSALNEDSPQREKKEACISKEPWATWKCDAQLSEKDRPIRERLKRFAGAGNSDPLFRFGPYAELIGRPIAACRMAGANGGRCELFRPDRLAQVDVKQDCLPLLIGGRVIGPEDRWHAVDLAVAVNGNIRGVVRSFLISGYGEAWTALLPEDSLRAGANEIKIYRLSGSGEGVELIPLNSEGS